MIGILESILCAIQGLAAAIVTLFVLAIDGAIIALGAMVAVIMALLPNMPSSPAAPSSPVLGFINWLFPIAAVTTLMTTFGLLLLAYYAVKIMLNWLRAL